MSNEANKELVTRYFDEVWNKGNMQVEDEYVSRDVIVHAPPSPGEAVWLLHAAYTFRAAMPDLAVLENLVFGDGDRVVQRWTATGTHSGAALYGSPASGRKLTVSGMNIFRIAQGKITERWSIIDSAGVMQQLRPN